MKPNRSESRHLAATFSFIIGFISLWSWMAPLFGITLSVIAIGLGILSWKAELDSTGQMGGRAGRTGVILGSVGLIINILLEIYMPPR